jgi:PAS domain S-box-containing protein
VCEWTGDLRHRTRDGGTVTVVARLVLRRDAGAGAVLEIVTDVTAQRQVEAALERLVLMAERVRDPVLLLGQDGRILEANAAATAAYGHDHAALLGLNMRDLRAPETREDMAVQMARAGQGGVLFETLHQRADGCCFPVEVSSIGAEVSGQRVLVSVIRDTTARKQAEAALAESEAGLRLALKGAQTGVHELDLARGLYRVDAAFARMSGTAVPAGVWLPFNDEFWREGHAHIHPDDLSVRQGSLDRVSQGDDAEAEFDFRMNRRDGSQVWLRQQFIAVERDPVTRRARRLLGLTRDVTQARDMQAVLERMVEERTRELRDAQKRLAHIERMQALGQLAGGIAHDINNVLQAVQGGGALLARRCDKPDQVRHLAELILTAAERGAAVTSRLLAFSRRSDLRSEPIDAALLLQGMQDMLAHALGTGIDVRIVVPDGLPPLVADKAQLETALVNLAANARDAMDGMGTLTLAAAEQCQTGTLPGGDLALEPGRYIHLSVTDTGCGMDQATMARATEPFYTTKLQGKGTGLGLAMARGFSEQSGGGILIESAPRQGTTVHLFFPVAANAPSSPGHDRHGARISRMTRSVRLLLVDDDAMVRDVVEAELQDAGMIVSPCESGGHALAHLDRGEAVDVLVSDLSMPVMDGLSLIREAKRRRPRLPTILLTGFSTNVADITRDGEFDGPFRLLRKPVSGSTIVELVASLLEETCVESPSHTEIGSR